MTLVAAFRATTKPIAYLQGLRAAMAEASQPEPPRRLSEAELRARAMYINTLRRDGTQLATVPPALLAADSPIRQDLCDAAFASPRPPRIRYVPADLLTTARCQAALARLPMDFGDVPDNLLTEAMCVAGIRATPLGGCPSYTDIPPRFRGTAVAEAMLAFRRQSPTEWGFPATEWFLPSARDSQAMRDFMREARPVSHLLRWGQEATPEQVISILSRHGDWKDVTPTLQDLEGIMQRAALAAQASGRDLDQPVADPAHPGRHALPNLRELSVWRWALSKSPASLHALPARLRGDYETLRYILSTGASFCLSIVPVDTLVAHPDLLEKTLAAVSFSTFDSPLHQLPAEAWTRLNPGLLRTLIVKEMRRNVETLTRFKELAPGLLTDDIYALAADCGFDLSRIPAHLKKALHERATRSNGNNLQHVPVEYRSRALCLEAVSNMPGAIVYVPEDHLTYEMVAMALQRDPHKMDTVLRHFGNRVPDALYVKAVTEWGAPPRDLPAHLLDAEVYRAAIRRDPEYMLDLAHETEHWMPALMRELIMEKPDRVIHFADGAGRLEWALLAYQHGASVQDAVQSLDGVELEGGRDAEQELMAAIADLPARREGRSVASAR